MTVPNLCIIFVFYFDFAQWYYLNCIALWLALFSPLRSLERFGSLDVAMPGAVCVSFCASLGG